MRGRLLAIPLAGLVAVSVAAATERSTVSHVVEVDGRARTYYLHVPPGLGAEPATLVLVFHGGGGNGPWTERLTHFSALADREGFLVAYPEGIGKNWNDGREVPRSQAHRDHVDDVGFVTVMLDTIARTHAVDARRVYATGISNGGVFSHYLAGRLASRIVAIAPVVGGIADPPDPWFRPERPVSVLILQGTADPLVPYHGGPVAFGRGRILDTEEAARRWARANGASAVPARAPLPVSGAPAGSSTERCGGTRTVYSGGRDGSDVVLVRLEGGGHTWPGGAQYLPQMLIGRVCHDFDATAVIWEFFKTHARRIAP